MDRRSLDVTDCLAVLRTASIGRLAVTRAALPTVFPVPVEVVGDEVLCWVGHDFMGGARLDGQIVCLGVEQVAPSAVLSHVTLIGEAKPLLAHLDVGGNLPGPSSAAGDWVRLVGDLIEGRAIPWAGPY